MITLDTSAILALLNAADDHHEVMVQTRDTELRPWYVPATVLSEVGYLVEHELGPQALVAFFQDIQEGIYVLACGEPNLERIVELVTRFESLPLGYADAAVTECAERHGGGVLTTDWRHFPVVAGVARIHVVPPGPYTA